MPSRRHLTPFSFKRRLRARASVSAEWKKLPPSPAPPPFFAKGNTRREKQSLPKKQRRAFSIPLVRLWFALLLLPSCYVSTETFFQCFAGAARHGLGGTAEWRAFLGGMGLWSAIFLCLPRPVYLYVLGHELTHCLFITLFGGKIHKIHVTSKGGFVDTDKTNLLIDLSPYFLPFWTMVLLLPYLILGLAARLGWWTFAQDWLAPHSLPMVCLFGLLGLSWAFHLFFTVWMIKIDQPDLKPHGGFFSLVLIYLSNLAVITGLMLLILPAETGWNFVSRWGFNFRELVVLWR